MKKIFFLIIIVLLFSSCLTKVNLERTGSLILALKVSESDLEATSISRSINSSTSTIDVVIHQKGKPETSQTITITHNNENLKHEVSFSDLIEGQWHLLVTFKDSSGQTINSYEDYFEIAVNTPTIIQTAAGGLKKITEVYEDIAYQGMYISDGATNVLSGQIGVVYLGNVYSNISPDEAMITFLIADNPSFINPITYLYPYSVYKGNIATNSGIYVNDGFSPNTKYYWKVIVVSDSTGTEQVRESNIFTFTTGTGTGQP